MNQPNHTPNCCNQPAKWVEQTPSLAYFYCEKCKTEPKAEELTSEVALKYANDSLWSGNTSPTPGIVYTGVGGFGGSAGGSNNFANRSRPLRAGDNVIWRTSGGDTQVTIVGPGSLPDTRRVICLALLKYHDAPDHELILVP